jgi:hypothetical protein
MRVSDFLEDKRAVFVANPKGRRTRYVFLPPDGVPFFRAVARGVLGPISCSGRQTDGFGEASTSRTFKGRG